MNYPLISEYIEAIKSAEDNFERLSSLRPVLGDDGLPVMTSGNFAVVFKMKDEQSGKFYAVKCFTKEQEGRAEAYREIAKELENVSSPYILSIQYLDKELFVDTDQTMETEFPVLLMDWVEGKTLDKYLRENLDDKYTLEMLAYRFSQLAKWLIPQPFAHGDLKPDNILVRDDGTLVLVDYDGMYVPAMEGQKARELGSPDFRHPLSTENDSDEHIDDFPLISILLSLKLVAYSPKLFETYGASDRLLLCRKDYIEFGNSSIINDVFPSVDQIVNNLVSVFHICLFDRKAGNTFLAYLQTDFIRYLSTKVSFSETEYIDEYGSLYSGDKKQLLRIGHCFCYRDEPDFYAGGGWIQLVSFKFETNIRVICNNSFREGLLCPSCYNDVLDLDSIDFSSIMAIGNHAFRGVTFNGVFKISANLIFLGKNPFALTDRLFLECSSSNFYLDEMALFTEDKKMLIHEYYDDFYWYRVPDGVKVIGEYSFSRKSFSNRINHYISLPDSVEIIEDYAFQNCNLCEIRMPRNIKSIGTDIFCNCNNLREIRIPVDSYDHYWELLPNYREFFVEEYMPNNINIQDFDLIEENLAEEEEIDAYIAAWEEEFLPYEIVRKWSYQEFAKGFDDLVLSHVYYSVSENIENACLFKKNGEEDVVVYNFSRLSLGQINKFKQFLRIELMASGHYVLALGISKECPIEDLNTAALTSYFLDCWIDEYGVKYSSDKKYLLEGPVEETKKGSHTWKKGVLHDSYDIQADTIVICDKAFFDCRGLTSIKCPNSLQTIGTDAFAGCWSLKDVDLNYGLLEIGDDAFKDCKSLKYIHVPGSISYIASNAFEGSGIGVIFTDKGDEKRVKTILPKYVDIIEELPF